MTSVPAAVLHRLRFLQSVQNGLGRQSIGTFCLILGISNLCHAQQILHQMVEKQLLDKENKNRWTTYTLLKEDKWWVLGNNSIINPIMIRTLIPQHYYKYNFLST